MAKSRNKTPTELKVLKGTDQPCRVQGSSVDFGIVLSIEPPEHLNERAQNIFIEKSQMLINQRILTEADIDLLVWYCKSLDYALQCDDLIEEKGLFYDDGKRNPEVTAYVKTRKQMFDECNKIGAQFGMSPTTRLISTVTETKDEFTKYLEG